jgi:hypothetical protein
MLVKLAILASLLMLELNVAHRFAHSSHLDLFAQPTSLVLAELKPDAEPEEPQLDVLLVKPRLKDKDAEVSSLERLAKQENAPSKNFAIFL